MRGKDKDKIILDILQNEARTRKELLDEAITQGIPESTAYRHIKKLIRLGKIREGKLEIVTQLEEANRQEVDNCLKILINENNEHVIYSRLDQLTKLSYSKRIAHFPNVIEKLASLFDKIQVIGNERNLQQFFECIRAILFFEQSHTPEKWKIISDRIISTTLEKAQVLLLIRPNSRIIEYLGMTNRESAVNTIFSLMEQHNIEANKNEFSSITHVLEKDEVYKKHKKIIHEKLDNFLRSGDKRLIKLAITIRERIVK